MGCNERLGTEIFQLYGLDPAGTTVQRMAKAFREPKVSGFDVERKYNRKVIGDDAERKARPHAAPPKLHNPHKLAFLPGQAWKDYEQLRSSRNSSSVGSLLG